MLKASRGLSSVMGSLFLILIVFVAWAALFRYALSYVHSTQGLPEVTVSSQIVSLNGGQVYMVEITLRSGGYEPFTLRQINIVSGVTTSFGTGTTLYTGFPVITTQPPSTTLPLTLRPGQTYNLYFFTNNVHLQPGVTPIVQVIGTYGNSLVQYQSPAEVLYG